MADIKISGLTPKGSALGPNDLLEVSVSQGVNYVTRSVKGEDIISAAGAIHVPLKPMSGQLVSLNISGELNAVPATFSSNTFRLFPFIPAKSFAFNQFQVNVTTPVVGGLAKILIYSDFNGMPSQKAFQSSQLDCSTTGLKTFSPSLLLYPGTTYWIGFNTNNSLIAFDSIEPKNLRAFGILSNNSGITAYQIPSITFGSEPNILPALNLTNQVNSAAPLFYIRST
jgi:hypothetical protein